MARNVQFYGSMNKALGGDPIQRDYAQDPRRLMAQQLMRQGSSTAPVQSPLEGLTRALTGIAGGYFGGQAQRDMQEREQARNEDINQVIAGGNAKQWVNPDTGHKGEVTPTHTYQSAEGLPCREFTQTIYVEGEYEKVEGKACRTSDGDWEVVG